MSGPSEVGSRLSSQQTLSTRVFHRKHRGSGYSGLLSNSDALEGTSRITIEERYAAGSTVAARGA